MYYLVYLVFYSNKLTSSELVVGELKNKQLKDIFYKQIKVISFHQIAQHISKINKIAFWLIRFYSNKSNCLCGLFIIQE